MLRLHSATRRLFACFMLIAFTLTSLGGADLVWHYGSPLLGQGEFPLFSFLGIPGVDWHLVKIYLECATGQYLHCFPI